MAVAKSNNNNSTIDRLIEIMAALRTPGTGCPWDLEQDFSSIAPYTLEEAYEVLDAIERGNMDDLKDELGDLLFQVIYHARMAEEADAFKFDDVVSCICEKMVRRHPHVFGDKNIDSAGDVNILWDEIKAQEKLLKAATKSTRDAGGPGAAKSDTPSVSILDDVPRALPALIRGLKLQKRAAKIGFDWPSLGPVFDKLEEEMGELSEAVSIASHDDIKEELGDVLFSLTNLARHLEIDPEDAMRAANHKFTTRFRHMESASMAAKTSLKEMSLDQMETLWQAAKQSEKPMQEED